MRESDVKRLGSGVLDLPEEDTGDRQQFIFYQDEGGLQATDEANRPMDTLYYLGIIDILTPYSTVKRLEHFWKGLKADRVSVLVRNYCGMLMSISTKLVRSHHTNMPTAFSPL